MQTPPIFSRLFKKTGFTLVELLVVMGIIAILAAVSLSVGGTVLRQAKKVKAQNTATQIQTAVLNYYTEYSVYPTTSSVSGDYEIQDDDETTKGGISAPAWGSLIECLSGMVQPSTGTTITTTSAGFTNTRNIAFLSLKATDVDTAASGHQDAPINPSPALTSNPYFNIAVDSDYDGIVGTGSSTVTNMPNFSGTFNASSGGSTTSGVAIWANCNQGTATVQAWYVHTY